MIPCYLGTLVLDDDSDHHTVFLHEQPSVGERFFPITIGRPEALAIDRALREVPFPRPLTHDLLTVLLAALHATPIEVRIVDVQDGTFFALLVLNRHDGSRIEIDCRPSDALALLVRHPGLPLLVAPQVLDEMA